MPKFWCLFSRPIACSVSVDGGCTRRAETDEAGQRAHRLNLRPRGRHIKARLLPQVLITPTIGERKDTCILLKVHRSEIKTAMKWCGEHGNGY